MYIFTKNIRKIVEYVVYASLSLVLYQDMIFDIIVFENAYLMLFLTLQKIGFFLTNSNLICNFFRFVVSYRFNQIDILSIVVSS